MAQAEKRQGKVKHWQNVVVRQAASGLSVAEFCRREDIAAWKFHYWKKQLSEEHDTAEVPKFQEVRMADVIDEPAELLFPNGLVLRIPTGFDEGRLRRLIDAIGAAPC